MANKDVDTKVVQVRFDNQRFEKNIKQTIKSTEELNESLKFKDAKKGIEDLSKSLEELDTSKISKDVEDIDKQTRRISLSFKELLKIKVLSRIIDKVTDSTVRMLKSMTGIDAIKAGWDAYNESLIVTGGILNQVSSKGQGLEEVSEALDQLRWYADETSYSFQTMSDGIRQFTIAGIDLEKATSAVQGVANLAGSAKVFDTFKVQSAMNAISKSMQTGYMDTLKWTTLTNTAGIVTQDFSDKLLKAAAAQGTLIETGAGQYRTKKSGKLVTTENIRDTLADRWLTSEVMTEVLGEYNSATEVVKGFMTAIEDGGEEVWASVNKNFSKVGKEFNSLDEMIAEVQENPEKYDATIVEMTKDMDANNITTRQAARLLKELGAEFDEVSYKAFMSSQETTSFSQAISYVGTAVKTSWQGVFQSMFGDVEKSTALWSDVSDKFYKIFVAPFNALEDQFKVWEKFEEGGAEDFRQAILNIIDALGEFTDTIKETVTEVLGDDLTQVLKSATIWLKDFTSGLKENETVINIVKSISLVLGNIFKIAIKIGKTVTKLIGSIITAAEPLFNGLSEIILMLAEGFSWLVSFIEETGMLQTIVSAVGKVIEAIGRALKTVAKAFKNSKGLITIAAALQLAFEGILWAITKVIDGIAIVITWIAELFGGIDEEIDGTTEKTNLFAEAIDNLRKFFEKLAAPFKTIIGFFKTMDFKSALIATIGVIADFGKAVKTVFVTAFNTLIKTFNSPEFKEAFNKIGEKLKPVWDFVKNLIWMIIKPLVEAVKTYDLGKVARWMLALLGVILLIKFVYDQFWIMYGYKKVLSSIADMFWALEARFKASFVRSWGFTILSIAALVWTLASVLTKIADLTEEHDWGKVLFSIGILGAIMIACASLLVITAIISKYARSSVRSGLMLFGFAGALSLAMSSVKKMTGIVHDIDQKDIDKAVNIFFSIGMIMAAVMFLSRLGGITPLAISFIKVILSIWAMLGIALWLFKQLKDVKQKDIDNGISIIQNLTAAFTVIMVVTKICALISATTAVKSVKGTISSILDVGNILISMALIIAAFTILLKQVKNNSWGDIGKTLAIFGTVFGAVTFISILSVAFAAIPVSLVQKGMINIGGVLAAMSFTMLAAILALKIAGTMRPEVIEIGMKRIIYLFIALGVIASVLLAIDRLGDWVVADAGGITNPNEFKMDWKSGFSRSRAPKKGNGIASILFAIAVVSLAAVAIMYLLAGMTPEVYSRAVKRFLQIFIAISAVAAILLLISKIPYKGTVGRTFRLTSSILIIIAALAAIIYAVTSIAKIGDRDKINHAVNTIIILMTALSAMMFIMAIVARILNPNAIIGIIGLVIIFASLAGVFATVIATLNYMETGAKKFIKIMKILASMNWRQMIGIASAFAIVMGTIIVAIGLLTVLVAGTNGVAIVGIITLFAILEGLAGVFATFIAIMNYSGQAIDNIEKLMLACAEVAPDDMKVLQELAKGMVAMGGAGTLFWTSVSEFNNFGTGIYNIGKLLGYCDKVSDPEKVGEVLINLAEGMRHLGLAGLFDWTSVAGFNNFTTGVENIGKLMKSSQGLDSEDISNCLIALAEGMRHLGLAGLFDWTAVSGFNNFTKGVENIGNLMEFCQGMNPEDIVNNLSAVAKGITALKDAKGKKEDYDAVTKYIMAIKSLLDSDLDIEPKITPMFDFTNFDAGLNYMRSSLGGMGTVRLANQVQNEYASSEPYRRGQYGQDNIALANLGVPGYNINLVQNNKIDPLTAGYQENRAIANLIDSALNSIGHIANKSIITKIFSKNR